MIDDKIADVVRGQLAREIESRFFNAAFGTLQSNNTAMTTGEPKDLLADLRAAIDALVQPLKPVKIVESVHMVDTHEDWSNVRSPSRTRRRMRYNHSRIFTYTPKTEAYHLPCGSLVMHPEMARHLRERMGHV